MKFLTKEDRENLFAEYNQLHEEIRERNNRIWIIDSILVTGSLLVTFQSEITSYLLPFVSLVMVLITLFHHYTGCHVNSINNQTLREIRPDLGLTRTNIMYESKMREKSWFFFRGMLP